VRKIAFVILALMLLLSGCSSQAVTAPTPSPTATIQPTPVPTPSPTPEPTPSPTPEPTPDPYFPDAEEVTVEPDNGYWLYRSPSLFVEVNRHHDEENVITYFVAEIRMKEGETERTGFGRPEKPGKRKMLYEIARSYQAVIAVNGDYLDYVEADPKGIIIRNGEVYAERDEVDTLAFYPDGTMRIIRPDEASADELLADGVQNSFSFGPTLINNGVIEPDLDKLRLASKKPRTAVGMIEPYHYLLVVVDGRQSKYSKGMTFPELADLFASYNCEVAYNLDGGASATMCFMGEHISQYAGSLTGQRNIPDALMFGFTPLLAEKEEE
jgi:hypothetical protein